MNLQPETGHRNPAKLECCSRSWRPVDPPSAKPLRQNAQVTGLAPVLINSCEHNPHRGHPLASWRRAYGNSLSIGMVRELTFLRE